MKKFLTILLVLIIVLVIASPFGTGYVIEDHYNNMIQQLNKAYKGDVAFTGKFKRGFMTSAATTDISINGVPITTLQHIVHHGPIIFNFTGWLKFSSYVPRGYGLASVHTQLTGKLDKKMSEIYSGKPSYDINTMLDFHGHTVTTVKSMPLITQIGSGILKWQGLNATINIDKDVKKIAATMLMPLLEYSAQIQPGSDTETIHISSFKIDLNKVTADGSTTMGIGLGAVKILNQSYEELSLTNATLDFNNKMISNIESIDFKTAFNKLKLHSHDIGPFAFNLKMTNINSAALMVVMQDPHVFANLEQKIQPNIPQDQLVAILNTKPIIDSDLKMTTLLGNIDYTGHAEIGGANIVTADPAVIIPTIKLSQKAAIGSKIFVKILSRYIQQQIYVNEKMYFMNNQTSTIPNPWTMPQEQQQAFVEKSVADIVNVLKQKQYILEENDIISSKLECADSIITINGIARTEADLRQLHALFQVQPPIIPATESGDGVIAPQNQTAPVAPSDSQQ